MNTVAGADRVPLRSAARRVLAVAATGLVIILALVAILTALRTELPRSPGVMTDSLGPESGERVEDYLARAADSLRGGDGDPDADADAAPDARAGDAAAPRWALVTAERAMSVPEATATLRGLPRVSGLYVQVPVDRVAMPVTGVTVPEPVAGESDREPVFERGLEQATRRLDTGARPGPAASTTPAPPDADRAAAVNALTASRIRAGEPAIIGVVARGTAAQLRAVAQKPGVRAVEALPADAVWERFAVRPLQPQQVDAALPLPDSAPVPPT